MAIVARETAIAERLKAFVDMNVLIVPKPEGKIESMASYNVAPSTQIPVVFRADSKIEIDSYRWGLIPHWAKDDSMANKCFNARSETMAEKPTFRQAFSKSRCVIPIAGYYEWQKLENGTKQPMFIHPQDENLMYLAGLCEPKTQSATVVTKEAEGKLRSIHTRQPIMLGQDDIVAWLDMEMTKDELQLLISSAQETVETYPVSKDVNSVINNDKHLIEPI